MKRTEQLILKRDIMSNIEICSSAHSSIRFPKGFSKNKGTLFLIGGDLSSFIFMKKMAPILLPDLDEFRVSCVINRKARIDSLLATCCPKKVNDMELICSDGLMKIQYYFPQVIRISPKIQCKMIFDGFEINEKCLCKFFAAFRHINSLVFTNSKLNVPKIPDFSSALNNTKLERLTINKNWRLSLVSACKDEPDELKNLIIGLSKSSDFKKSFLLFNLASISIEEQYIRSILDENDFKHVELWI
ncbi:unnamed protein product [Moneuplotes crassus]|uniref:Uncharacterized protein n=1 Tax=Euplotes crassus TaxID=5936 RepID=A0AAD2CZ64_EUPCR|nr:unnamed protein product [Moneuplotes crassus]